MFKIVFYMVVLFTLIIRDIKINLWFNLSTTLILCYFTGPICGLSCLLTCKMINPLHLFKKYVNKHFWTALKKINLKLMKKFIFPSGVYYSRCYIYFFSYICLLLLLVIWCHIGLMSGYNYLQIIIRCLFECSLLPGCCIYIFLACLFAVASCHLVSHCTDEWL